MKKILLTISAVCLTASLMAGGLVTNTNQSAAFTRLLSKNASIMVDAAYFNPAGLTKLNDGIHVSLSNQIITQTKTIINNYALLNDDTYVGDVKAPFFPSFYGVYKKGKFAVSLGFNPIGGGGGAEYSSGLPSFEMDIADLVPLLGSFSIPADQYSADIYLEGTSIYFGYQANVAYAINDMLSVAVGARLVTAKNTQQGSIKNIMSNPTVAGVNDGSMTLMSPFFTAIGQPVYAAMTADRELDIVQTGTGFTPIFSVNVTPIEILNIALRYEAKTKLELETEVIDDKGAGMFETGDKIVADMPAMLAIGVDVKPIEKLLLSGSMTMYMDKNNDYDGSADLEVEMIDKNFISYSFGAEYAINDMFKLGAGYSGTSTGVNELYQSDLRYSLNTTTFGGGLGISISPLIDVNLGAMITNYDEGEKDLSARLVGSPFESVPVETYDTKTVIFSVGVDLHF